MHFLLALTLSIFSSKALVMTGLGVGILGMSWLTKDVLVAYLIQLGLFDASGNVRSTRTINVQTANYAVLDTDAGTMFTNRGAVGPVTYTLPAPAPSRAGRKYSFVGVAGQNFTVSAGAGNGVAFNNAACTSLSASTAGQLIGARIEAVCDGTSWLLYGVTVGVTYTVA